MQALIKEGFEISTDKSRLDIERNTTIPFIGDVPKADNPNEIIQLNSRTNTAEAIRIIRTNLEFLLKDVPEGSAKTIFVTSTFPKEGKFTESLEITAPDSKLKRIEKRIDRIVTFNLKNTFLFIINKLNIHNIV